MVMDRDLDIILFSQTLYQIPVLQRGLASDKLHVHILRELEHLLPIGRFLRHIERNSILLFMIPADTEDAGKEYEILLNELKEYNPELLVKSRVLAISKTDMIDGKRKAEIEKTLPAEVPHLFISSVSGENIQELKDLLWKTLQEQN